MMIRCIWFKSDAWIIWLSYDNKSDEHLISSDNQISSDFRLIFQNHMIIIWFSTDFQLISKSDELKFCWCAFYQPVWGPNFYAFPPVDDSFRALEHILNQPDARGLLILPLWVRLNSYHRLFPDGNHFIPQVIGWTLLGHGDFIKGNGHASFLSPEKGGHRTPFVAILLDTSVPTPFFPSPRFCLRSYYGVPSECTSCGNSMTV